MYNMLDFYEDANSLMECVRSTKCLLDNVQGLIASLQITKSQFSDNIKKNEKKLINLDNTAEYYFSSLAEIERCGHGYSRLNGYNSDYEFKDLFDKFNKIDKTQKLQILDAVGTKLGEQYSNNIKDVDQLFSGGGIGEFPKRAILTLDDINKDLNKISREIILEKKREIEKEQKSGLDATKEKKDDKVLSEIVSRKNKIILKDMIERIIKGENFDDLLADRLNRPPVLNAFALVVENGYSEEDKQKLLQDLNNYGEKQVYWQLIRDEIKNRKKTDSKELDVDLLGYEVNRLEELQNFSVAALTMGKEFNLHTLTENPSEREKDLHEDDKTDIGIISCLYHDAFLNSILDELYTDFDNKIKVENKQISTLYFDCIELINRYRARFSEGRVGVDPKDLKEVIDKLKIFIKMTKQNVSESCKSSNNKELKNEIQEQRSEHKTVEVSEIISNEDHNVEKVGNIQDGSTTIESEPIKKQNTQTLRQKFDINNEEDFDKLLAHYAQVNKEYYSTDGKKSEEDMKQRRNINAQMKRILNKKAKTMPQNENGEEFANTIKSIESGNVFSYAELKQVAESKKASIELFQIMASGVYEKDGQRIRLTSKQRIALASTLEIVSGMRMDMDKAKKTEAGKGAITSENAKHMGE